MKENCYPNINQKMISHTCGNGLKICVFPKPGFRRSYAMLAVNYGSIDISFDLGGEKYTSPLGVAHFLEHKVFEQPDICENRCIAKCVHRKNNDGISFFRNRKVYAQS